MSEQLPTTVTSGLMSLNNVSMSQGGGAIAPAEGGGQVSGFGTVLNQQIGTAPEQTGSADGALLPSQGITLPPSAEGENPQQQLLYLAQMLEQTGQMPDLTSQINKELAAALRKYTDQESILPQAEVQGVVHLEKTEITAHIETATDSEQSKLVQTVTDINIAVQQVAFNQANPLNKDAKDNVQQEIKADIKPLIDNSNQLNSTIPIANTVGEEVVKQSEAQTILPVGFNRPVIEKDKKTDTSENLIKVAPSIEQDETFIVNKSDSGNITRLVANDVQKPESVQTLKSDVPVSTIKSEPVVVKQPDTIATAPKGNDTKQDAAQIALQNMISADKATEPSAIRTESKSADSLQALNSSVTQTVAQPEQVQAQKIVTDAKNLMMPQQVKLNTAAWENALGERAIMVATRNAKVAEIKLDPPELGSLNIRVHISQDQVNLSFTSPNAQVREAVEQSMPRLREMFAEQGLALQDSSVSDQSSQQQQMAEQQGQGGDAAGYGEGAATTEIETAIAQGLRPVSLVDYYA